MLVDQMTITLRIALFDFTEYICSRLVWYLENLFIFRTPSFNILF